MVERQFSEDEVQAILQQQQQQAHQPNPNDPNAVYADVAREERVTNIISQIDPEKLMADIEHRIRGQRKNQLTNEWETPEEGKLVVSEILISNMTSFLSSVLSQNTSLSNFQPREINDIMDLVIDHIGMDFYVNETKYGINGNYAEMSRIGNIVVFSVFSVLKRAVNGMEARRMFGALSMTDNLSQPSESKGLVDSLMFWKK